MRSLKDGVLKFLSIATAAVTMQACTPSLNLRLKNNIKVQETREEIGRQVCKTLEPGKYEFGDFVIYCHNDESFWVQNEDGSRQLYGIPETNPISETDLDLYIKDKRIVLFGEDHSPHAIRDGKMFIDLMPKLKQAGFTHIGLEFDRDYYQPMFDKYEIDNDDREIAESIKEYMSGDESLSIIRAAKENGLKIICLDARNPKRFTADQLENADRKIFWSARDNLIFENVEEALSTGAKIAVFIGAGHITADGVSTFIQGVTNNGYPRVIQLHKPLGYRLARKYGDKFGSVDLTGCEENTSRFIDACVE